MNFNQEIIHSLRQALEAAPHNPALRRHLAEILLAQGQVTEAENEYRTALKHQPSDPELRLGLARVFVKQTKYSAALVLLEELLQHPDPLSDVHLLYVRALLAANQDTKALQYYLKMTATSPELADAQLEQELKLDPPLAPTQPIKAEPEAVNRVRLSLQSETKAPEQSVDIEKPNLTFAEVGGMQRVKEEIELKIIQPLRYPELYQAYGKSIGGGILMYGPPGCGKTYLARATAGEVQANFIAVGISDILDMWLGQSERNLHAIFEQARAEAPCVLFFDEVDALGANRTDLRHSAGRQLINQFLLELDGMQHSNEGILILAATNAPWHLDPAFRRPGRFDRMLFVSPPDQEARSSIFKLLLAKKPCDPLDFEGLAKKSEGFSGADLKAVVDIAIESKLREAMQKGAPTPLTTKDLLLGIKTHKPTIRDWFNTARNYALYANQGGLYDDVLEYLKLK